MSKLAVLKAILAENLDIDPESVKSDSTFESLGIDSLDLLEIITELEDRLDILASPRVCKTLATW